MLIDNENRKVHEWITKFTDLTPWGPDGLFSSPEVDELMAVLDAVRATAVAA